MNSTDICKIILAIGMSISTIILASKVPPENASDALHSVVNAGCNKRISDC